MALPSHAVPQNILEVEFQLFGSLTIKQFAYVAGGIGMALVCYWIFGKVPIIQWPLSIFFLIMGFMLALWKINEMPFEVWLMNYIAAIFTTQRSIYQKSKKLTSIFDILDKSTTRVNSQKSSLDDSALAAVNASYSFSQQNTVDKVEDEDLKDIDSLFSDIFSSKTQISSTANSYFETYKLANNVGKTDIDSNQKLITNTSDTTNIVKAVTQNYTSLNLNPDQITKNNNIVKTNKNNFQAEFNPITRFGLDEVKEPITKYTKSEIVPESIIAKQQDLNSFLQDSATRLITAKKLEKKDTNSL